ncbi:hypothetical protein [Lacipirellula limnantheis]|uniref:Uncharacterized protein n=1 Tax=Lacipirellula limnantheis TaxID=2528024 RepID=A0A517U1C6_9BACT|nr:hypothetical protein [Lacipirellula limnantheis]QDT74438.1 hypothetical protein I41_36340 [Lacipirellula limnantheis]
MAPVASEVGIEIHADRMYDLPALKKLGWGAAALRVARRKHGLKVYRSGRKSWVEGSDLIAAIKASAVVPA